MGTRDHDRGGASAIEQSIAAAAKAGARVLTGGERDGAVIAADRRRRRRPVVAVQPGGAVRARRSRSARPTTGRRPSPRPTAPRSVSAAGIFTADIAGAVRAIREIDAGNIHINWTPLWRADLMPYGGLKGSGIGKEGPRTAVAEMTEEKTVVLHGRPW